MAVTLPAFWNMKYTKEDGYLDSDGYLYNDQMFQVLNSVITLQGINVPSFTATQVSAFPLGVSVGTIWYNSTLDKLQFQSASAVQTIMST